MQLPKRKPGKYAMVKPDHFLTQQKYDELSKKLRRLKEDRRPKAAKEVARLAELGDFSENVEYQLAKRRLRGINSGILKIEHLLNRAEIISPDATDVVAIGHTVTVEKEGKKKAFTILGSNETDPSKGIISHRSPIGLELLGKKVGDVARVLAGKKEIVYTILKITHE